MAKTDKYPKVNPVIVKWVDAISAPGWRDYEKANIECISIGHLVSKDKDMIVICQNRSAEGGGGDFMSIPIVAIKSVKKLKV